MSWAQKLYETYDRVIGAELAESSEKPIVPVGFKERKADYLVILNQDAECVSVEKFGEKIVAPTLASAEGKTGNMIVPYPFFDEIRYVAGDFDDYLIEEFNERDSSYVNHSNSFIEQLTKWCERDDVPEYLRTILKYVKSGRLMRDMKSRGFRLSEKDIKKTVVFDVTGQALRAWECPDLKESWLNYLRESSSEAKQLCYVSGSVLPIIKIHPKPFGNPKLISGDANDNPFQYMGRFKSYEEALSMSMEASTKIHNALRWLIERQGFSRFGIKVVLWSPGGEPVADPFEQELGLTDDAGNLPDTMQVYGLALTKAIAGYKQKLIYSDNIDFSQVIVMGLQAATTGRMSITHYQEMSVSEYTDSLKCWYSHCAWRISRKIKDSWRNYISTPTPREIAEAVFGSEKVSAAIKDFRVDKSITKQISKFYMRLLPCIIHRRPLPLDIERTAFRHVCTPNGFTTQNGKWDKSQWERALCVTCALVAKRLYDEKKGVLEVALDTTNTERNYLYGRLLAVANQVEMLAMGNFSRQTNAIRYMQAFQLKPVETWRRINNLLIPYLSRLRNAGWYQAAINEIGEKIDFTDNTPLDGRFLGGYYAQGYAYKLEADKRNRDKEASTNDAQQ